MQRADRAAGATSPELSAALRDVVNVERQAAHLPGLAAVIVRSDAPPISYVSGERRIGKGDMLAPADRMHLGSLTKGIMATVVGALVEKRLMTFDTTIGQAFSELSAQMQPGYRNVSVRQTPRLRCDTRVRMSSASLHDRFRKVG